MAACKGIIRKGIASNAFNLYAAGLPNEGEQQSPGRFHLLKATARFVPVRLIAIAIAAALASGSALVVDAQPGSPLSTSPASQAASGANPAPQQIVPALNQQSPKVDRLIFATEAYCGSKAHPRKYCRLGDTLFVGFSNLREWMEVSSNRLSDVVLVLNGRIVKGVTSRGPDDSYSGLQFDLKRLDGDDPTSQENREAWNLLVAELRQDNTLQIAVASGGNPPFWGSTTLQFVVFPSYTWAVIVLLLVLLISFLILARKSDILRDAPTALGQPKQSYSLARCQMAWWFFIIAASFCYIWLTLSNYDSLTAGVLILTGISAGTGLASIVIDSNKREQRQALVKEQAVTQDRLAALPAEIAAAAGDAVAALKAELLQKTNRLAEINASLASLPSEVGPSEGFLRDIMRDESGISFHRFQMVAWTVILGFVFVSAVYMHLSMPNFSATLLGLLGISSGTYVGFKIPDPPK